MRRKTKQIFLFALAFLMLAGSVACGSGNDAMNAMVQSLTQERKELQEKLDTAQKELNDIRIELNDTKNKLLDAESDAEYARQELQKARSAPTPQPSVVTQTETVTEKYAYGVGCTVNGSSSVKLEGEEKIKCVANEIEGYVFDHWEINGTPQDATDKTLEFVAAKTTLVQAVFHERHTLKCINCHFEFLNVFGNAAGKDYTEFDFEEDYQNPNTKETVTGGLMSFYVFADVPRNQQVDYWLINNVKYQFPQNVVKFRIEDLDEATVIEVVFKGQTRQKTPAPGKTPAPDKTPAPTKTYNVTCHSCKFMYNGSWKTSGKVPAGTKITISGTTDSTEAYFDGTPSSVNRHFTSPSSGSSGKWVFTYTYTVNSDVDVWFRGVVN